MLLCYGSAREVKSEYDKIRKEDELENISRTYQVKVLMMFIILN